MLSALFLARLLGPLDIAAHLGFEIPGHQLLLGRIAAEVFVLFHIDAVIGQMAGRQGAGRLAAQAAGDGVVGDGFRGIEDQIGLGEDLFDGRSGRYSTTFIIYTTQNQLQSYEIILKSIFFSGR